MNSSKKSFRPFDDRFVAFVDVLGFRSIIERMKDERDLFVTVRDALKTIDQQARQFEEYRLKYERSRRSRRKRRVVELVPPPQLEMTAFSDCYLISEKFPAWHVVAAVQALGSNLLGLGILCRGAIVHGAAYHKKRIAFGPAIIEAYELESHVAKYPRILVTDRVREAIWGYHQGLCRGHLLLQDSDGCWFINVLAPPLSKWEALSSNHAKADRLEFLTRVGNWLRDELHLADNDLNRLSKLRWLVHHFNVTAREEPSVEMIEETRS